MPLDRPEQLFRVEELSELRHESDGFVAEFAQNLSQFRVAGQVQAYLDGRINLRVVFGCRLVGVDGEKHRAVFQAAVGVNDAGPFTGQFNLNVPQRVDGGDYYAVFVRVVEVVNDPQRVVVWGVRSKAWLETLDERLGGWRRFNDFRGSGVFVAPERGVFVDGEAAAPSGGLAVGKCELPDQMVERRTKVVSDITDADPPINQRGRVVEVEPETVFQSLRVWLSDNASGLSFDPLIDFRPQFANVSVGSIRFSPHTVQ